MPAATIATEQPNMPALTTSREPKAPKRPGSPGSVGDQTLQDALIAIGVSWGLLFLLAFSLRRHNI